jgi:hypothetical protein
MVVLDDHQHGDTVPPLTLWQMMQMAPFVLFLREYDPMPICFSGYSFVS